jgi:hypothetical protein
MPKADSAVLGNPLAFVVGATMLLGIPHRLHDFGGNRRPLPIDDDSIDATHDGLQYSFIINLRATNVHDLALWSVPVSV